MKNIGVGASFLSENFIFAHLRYRGLFVILNSDN